MSSGDRPASPLALDAGASEGWAVEAAGPRDAALLLALREAQAAWLAGRGIEQWKTGEVPLDEIERQIRNSEWHVVRDERDLAAGVRLLWQDDDFWGVQPPTAAYVHGLMVDRRHAGRRLGRSLIAWAGGQAQRAGRSLLRLDCAEDNLALHRYYTDQGFKVVGRRDFDSRWSSVVLLEKVV